MRTANEDDWKTERVEHWSQFQSAIDKIRSHGKIGLGWLFRGQSDATWNDLRPRLTRILNAAGAEGFWEVESRATSEFRAIAHHYLSMEHTAHLQSLVDWWSLMQHHGAPTKLLDWTRSLYVAAYFACRERPFKDGVVWLLDVPSTMIRYLDAEAIFAMSDIPDDEWLHSAAKQYCTPIRAFTAARPSPRMVAQQGAFTVVRNPLEGHARVVSYAPDGAVKPQKELIRKLVIPSASKSEFMWRLREMNISARTLFPGVDGLAKSVEEMVYTDVSRNAERGDDSDVPSRSDHLDRAWRDSVNRPANDR